MEAIDPLFDPVQIGALLAPNRIFMAPLTRSRASDPGGVPTQLMAEYYAQRASVGLIVSEATNISEVARATPGRRGSTPTRRSTAGEPSPARCTPQAAASSASCGTWAGCRTCRCIPAGPGVVVGAPVRQVHGLRRGGRVGRRVRRPARRGRWAPMRCGKPARTTVRRPRAPSKRASTAWRCTAPTATCCSSSPRRTSTTATTSTAARWRIAPGSTSRRWLLQSMQSGRIGWACGSHRFCGEWHRRSRSRPVHRAIATAASDFGLAYLHLADTGTMMPERSPAWTRCSTHAGSLRRAGGPQRRLRRGPGATRDRHR